jgi:hypothetical protein
MTGTGTDPELYQGSGMQQDFRCSMEVLISKKSDSISGSWSIFDMIVKNPDPTSKRGF